MWAYTGTYCPGLGGAEALPGSRHPTPSPPTTSTMLQRLPDLGKSHLLRPPAGYNPHQQSLRYPTPSPKPQLFPLPSHPCPPPQPLGVTAHIWLPRRPGRKGISASKQASGPRWLPLSSGYVSVTSLTSPSESWGLSAWQRPWDSALSSMRRGRKHRISSSWKKWLWASGRPWQAGCRG